MLYARGRYRLNLEPHLSRAYRKLGICSRCELIRSFAMQDREAGAGPRR